MNNIAREQADLYQDFFNFLNQEHNLICTIEEMDEIIYEAQNFVKKFDIANVVKQSEQLKPFHCPNCNQPWDTRLTNSCQCGASINRF